MPRYTVLGEKVVYKRYLTMLDREVKVEPLGSQPTVLHYDIVGHPQCNYQFAVTFPVTVPKDGSEAQVTIIREYAQGPNCFSVGLPTGGFDPRKHSDIEACARAELSEEALLHGGELVRLIGAEHPGFAEVKWCANRFVPFLTINPQTDPTPGERDAEEHIQVLTVPISELRRMMLSGDMMLPSITTCHLALTYLEERGIIPRPGAC